MPYPAAPKAHSRRSGTPGNACVLAAVRLFQARLKGGHWLVYTFQFAFLNCNKEQGADEGFDGGGDVGTLGRLAPLVNQVAATHDATASAHQVAQGVEL